MQLIIHRGTHEIGGTCVEIKSEKSRIIVDLGIPLADPKDKKKKFDSRILRNKTIPELLKEGILPKVNGLYAGYADEKPVNAVLISHPHQDHYGFCSYIRRDVPIILGEDTAKMLKVSDVFLNKLFSGFDHVSFLKKGQGVIGDIRVKSYLMDHSGYGAMAFLINAGGKKLFYSGDFRAHGRKGKLFELFLKNPPKKVDVLLMEGTMLGRPGERVRTEDDLELAIASKANKHAGIKFFICSGQNVDRIVTFYRAAKRSHAIFVMDLYIANVIHELGRRSLPCPTNGFKDVKVLFTKHFMKSLSRKDKKEWYTRWRPYEISPEELGRHRGKVFVAYRNSSIPEIEKAGVPSDSVLFYSQWSDYMKEPSFDITQEFIKKYAITRIDEHTSGHAPIEDLKRLAKAVDPRQCIIPIHTEKPDKFREYFGDKVRVLSDEECLEL